MTTLTLVKKTSFTVATLATTILLGICTPVRAFMFGTAASSSIETPSINFTFDQSHGPIPVQLVGSPIPVRTTRATATSPDCFTRLNPQITAPPTTGKEPSATLSPPKTAPSPKTSPFSRIKFTPCCFGATPALASPSSNTSPVEHLHEQPLWRAAGTKFRKR